MLAASRARPSEAARIRATPQPRDTKKAYSWETPRSLGLAGTGRLSIGTRSMGTRYRCLETAPPVGARAGPRDPRPPAATVAAAGMKAVPERLTAVRKSAILAIRFIQRIRRSIERWP